MRILHQLESADSLLYIVRDCREVDLFQSPDNLNTAQAESFPSETQLFPANDPPPSYTDDIFELLQANAVSSPFIDRDYRDDPFQPPNDLNTAQMESFPSEIRRPPSNDPPLSYPDDILELAFRLTEHPDKRVFFPIWRRILSYWFPPELGFELVHDWGIPPPVSGAHRLGTGSHSFGRHVTFAVLHGKHPLVLLQTRGTLDCTNDTTRRWARAAASNYFDMAVASSSTPAATLCVISSMGLKWNAFLRPTDMTSAEAQATLGYDWFGEWEEDVVSASSFEALKHCFCALKLTVDYE